MNTLQKPSAVKAQAAEAARAFHAFPSLCSRRDVAGKQVVGWTVSIERLPWMVALYLEKVVLVLFV